MSRIIDVHCHLFTFSQARGGYVNPRFGKSIRARMYMQAIGVISKRDALRGAMPAFEELDDRYEEILVKGIHHSSLDHAVVLALDGAYDEWGEFDRLRTRKMISNDAAIRVCKRSPKLLFGASINPLRNDARKELEKCLAGGAVLMKSLSNVQGFDPAEKRHDWFYEELRRHRVPVLQHIGMEYAVPNIDLRFADMDRLEAILRRGNTVIAAHCCGGRPFVDDMHDFDRMLQLVRRYDTLYLDVSGMAAMHRKSRLLNSLKHSEIRQRLVYGTDFPIPTHAWAFPIKLRKHGVEGRVLPQNYFDRDIVIKKACGLDDAALARGYAALASRFQPATGSARVLVTG